MANTNQQTLELIKDLEQANKYIAGTNKKRQDLTNTASNLAFIYERARNAVEFRDENLVRISAIERILKRRIFLSQDNTKIAKHLIKELSWAKYLINDNEHDKSEQVSNIISKYREVIKLTDSTNAKKIITICSCEIEDSLNFNPINQIIINYISTSLFHKIGFSESDKSTKSIQIYIAVERTFAKNSDDIISYKLLKVMLPNWSDPLKFLSTFKEVENHLNYENKDLIRRKINQLIPPFNLIRVLIKENPDFIDLVSDGKKLESVATKLLEEKYAQIKDKVLRASKRSIIYIFFTKMILAIVVEIPFEILFSSINYVVLAINILFPPTLMILFNSSVNLPSKGNTENLVDSVYNYFYLENSKITSENIIDNKILGKSDKTFSYFFIFTSILMTLGILWLLTVLGFSFISQIIFLFFLSVVSFFAFRVREISKEYQMQESITESFFETLLDYIFLPIIKMGQLLSNQITKINILSFIFDFIIEAPLKSFLEILEDWLHFVRVKKQEILS